MIHALSKLMRVEMTLQHVLYVSYLVEASRLHPLVPAILPLALVEERRAFVSIVVLRSSGVRLSFPPVPRFNYNQINLRTYVTDPQTGGQAVYFLKSGVTSKPISILTRIMGIPWHHIFSDMQVNINDRSRYDIYHASGKLDGDFFIEGEESPCIPEELAPFNDTESAVDYLVRPLIGFLSHRGKVKRFKIWHPDIYPRFVKINRLHLSLLKSMNIINEAEIDQPHNVLLVPRARFHIYLPPVAIGTDKGNPQTD